jgi:spore germination protein D
MAKVRYSVWVLSVLISSLLLASCGGGGSQGSSQPDYKSIKTMVLDIMQSEDGKKTIANTLKDKKVKEELLLDTSTIQSSLIQSFAKPDNPKIKEAFQDPKFTTTLAKAMKNEQKNLMKDLMKDPEYQKLLISTLQDPEYERAMLQLMKSSAYRKQTMQIMMEALQSPLFQAKLLKLMEKAAEEAMKPKKQGQGGGGGGDSQSGDGGDGGGQ